MSETIEDKFDRNELGSNLVAQYDNSGDDVSGKKKSKIFRIRNLIILILLIVIGYFVYKYVDDNFDLFGPKEILFIKADLNPHRIKPEDPGGMIIANRNKTVYETIAKANGAKEKKLPIVTKLMPPPEKPLKRADIFADEDSLNDGIDIREIFEDSSLTQEQKQKEELIKNILKDNNNNPNNPITEISNHVPDYFNSKEKASEKEYNNILDIPFKVDGVVNDSTPDDSKEVDEFVQQNTPQESERKIRIMVKPKSDYIINKDILKEPIRKISKYQLQLGAYKSKDDAKKDQNRLQSKYKSLLKNQEFNIEKADLGSKGIFYRLKVISFKNESSARSLCDDLRLKNQACIFIRN